MANTPDDLKYAKTHEWLRLEGDVATVGITDHAQSALGDVVFVELPEVGKTLAQGSEAAVVESVKAASEIYAPVAGEVTAVNTALEATPGMVNEDAVGTGWFLKLRISDQTQLEALMDEAQYAEFLKTLN